MVEGFFFFIHNAYIFNTEIQNATPNKPNEKKQTGMYLMLTHNNFSPIPPISTFFKP